MTGWTLCFFSVSPAYPSVTLSDWTGEFMPGYVPRWKGIQVSNLPSLSSAGKDTALEASKGRDVSLLPWGKTKAKAWGQVRIKQMKGRLQEDWGLQMGGSLSLVRGWGYDVFYRTEIVQVPVGILNRNDVTVSGPWKTVPGEARTDKEVPYHIGEVKRGSKTYDLVCILEDLFG